MMASFPCAAAFWTAYETSKGYLKQYDHTLSSPVQHFIAAAIGETTQAIVRNPFEVIK